MQPTTILIIFGSTLLYFYFGIGYTNTLQRRWPIFRKITNKHPAIYAFALIAWLTIFMAHITWRLIESLTKIPEELTKSRESDWVENENITDIYPDEDLPEFLKRQSD